VDVHDTVAVVTVGSELTEGLRVDTNTQTIALALAPRRLRVCEALSVPDDVRLLATTLKRLTAEHPLVIVTGGLGPTHDDVTREAAAEALGLSLAEDPAILAGLSGAASRHADPDAATHIARMAQVLEGARVLPAVVGTAPGQIVPTPAGRLVLLPGPPREMAPLLEIALADHGATRAVPLDLGVTGMPESDVQLAAQRALAAHPEIDLTVLARPGEVRVVLLDAGAGAEGLERAADAVAREIGDACFTRRAESLAEVVVREAAARSVTVALAESCTGGMIASALTDVAGSSAMLAGGAVTYSDASKAALLGVSPETLAAYGAVSAQTAEEMAAGALEAFEAHVAVSVTGIAGPGGGSAEKPVGTVWCGVLARGTSASDSEVYSGGAQLLRRFPGDRVSVRQGATAYALDLLRRAIMGLPLPPSRQ